MGRVYEASDLQLNRRVAIKVIRRDMHDGAADERFLREARAAAALSHPNACRLYEVGEYESEPFLVMELLEGESLQERLTRGRMPTQEAADVLLPLMSALVALHDAGLVHRDLKPANVFLTADSVKLLDFGLARVAPTADAQTMAALTAPGAVTGTVRYMSPEQIAGDPIDTRTDVFALGVLLFEMITGEPPFNASSNVDWINAVMTSEPPTLPDEQLKPFEPVVVRALQRRPDDRFASVREMADALAAAVRGEAVEVPAVQTNNGASGAVVLPFRLLHTGPDLEFLGDSIPEALTAMLSERPEFQMVSSRLGQPFADEADLTAVGQSLHVGHVLTGSVQRAGDEVRATVQLVRVADGRIQWSHVSEHTATTPLALQDAICRAVVEQLPDPTIAS